MSEAGSVIEDAPAETIDAIDQFVSSLADD